MQRFRCLVIGGGAAGMLAAIGAAERGGAVALLESNRQPGKKILVSGNGRCNLTNVEADQPGHYHGRHPGFVRPALAAFPLQQTLQFFADLGIATREEKRGRLFPLSDQAQSVVDVLQDRLRVLGVRVACQAKAVDLQPAERFRVTTQDGTRWEADRVVLASGGCSVPKLGADRSGLELAARLGHTITRLHPGLVPLESPDEHVRRMQGVKVFARVRAVLSPRRTIADTDDLLFTPYGVSGFTILNLSAQLVPLLERGPLDLEVSLFPASSPEQVSELLQGRWARNPHRSLAESFAGLLSSKLVGPFLARFGFPADQRVEQIPKGMRWRLAQALTAWPIPVSGPRSFEFAEVTLGGIETGEVDARTLESRLVPGLHFAGEMLDIHGDLGGYNFQWAWSSGYLAGREAGGG